MRKLPKKLLTTFVVTTLAGACLHFLYVLLPNPVTALLAPVNESLWEHLKIFFWPYLAAALLLTRGGERGCRAPWMLSALLLCVVMLCAGYFYHIVLGGERLAVDLGLYVLLMAAGFLLPGVFCHVGERTGVRDIILLLTVTMAGAIAIFTFLPPDQILFTDLSGVNTWATIPY